MESGRRDQVLLHRFVFWTLLVAGAFFIALSVYIEATDPWDSTWQHTLFMGLGIACFPSGILGLVYRFFLSHELEEVFRSSVEVDVAQPVVEKFSQKVDMELDDVIDALKKDNKLLERMHEFGVVMIDGSRDETLDRFINYIEQEKEGVQIIGSSLKGLLGTQESPNQEVRDIFLNKLEGNKCFFQFLLTHPALACLREDQEGRKPGAIRSEIIATLRYLVDDLKVPYNCIKLYYGTPTNFIIITSERMLINPYPYHRAAYENFCLEVEKRKHAGIYRTLKTAHFTMAWGSATAVEFRKELLGLLEQTSLIDFSLSQVKEKLGDQVKGKLGVN